VSATVHPLPVGARVRHYGQQYPAARAGTATITEVKGPYRDGSYEYLVNTGADLSRPPSESNPETDLRWWSSFATLPADEDPQLADLLRRMASQPKEETK
jgi:hypothetical protein